MPLLNEKFWKDRFGKGDPCWSGDKWLDWEHATVVRRALRRAWPDEHVTWILDVGCGDGKWTEWMTDEFPMMQVLATDALQYPGVADRVMFFVQADAEQLHLDTTIVDWYPELVVCLNTITCVENWREATASMRAVSDGYVLLFDNFQTPTPPWWTNLPHRKPIELPDLIADFAQVGWIAEKVITGDNWHRRLFLKTPKWTHPVVAVVSAILDAVAARRVDPYEARHQAVLFKRGWV